MNSPFFIAKRYLFSKKTHNVINLISGISIFGIMVSTAALVIVLSSFSGLEGLIASLYSDYYQDIQIESEKTKTFDRNFIPREIYETEGLINYSEMIEDVVMVKSEDHYIFTSIIGVERQFLEMCRINEHIDEGLPILEDEFGPLALIGVDAMMNLDAYVYAFDGNYESVIIYAPNRTKEISRNMMDAAFTTSRIELGGSFVFGAQETDNLIMVPIDFAAQILVYDNEISSIQMDFTSDTDLEDKKAELQEIIGPDFRVKTNYEQNELIYKTSRSEKWYTTLLLAFIFFLATFNMVATITMIVIEKKDNLKTLWALGARKSQLEKIFFYEGLLINGLGVTLGLGIGYFFCFLQQTVGLIRMQGVVEYYPVVFKLEDLLLILAITISFGTVAAWAPGKFLIKRIINR